MLLVFVGHLLACVGVLVLMPGGWPIASAAFIGYRVLPVVVGLMLLGAIAGPRRYGVDRLMLALLGGAWLGAAVLSLIMFPVSGRRLAVGAAGVAFILALAWVGAARSHGRRERMRTALASAIGLLVSIVPLRLLRSPPASTRPQVIPFVPVSVVTSERRTLRLNPHFALDSAQATVTVSAGRRYAYIEPVLTFVQRSPDACWTIFAPQPHRVPPTRNLQETSVVAGEAIETSYIDESADGWLAEHRLAVRRVDDESVHIEATTNLGRTMWSHLNTFTQVTVAGHRNLRLRFSPAPATSIDVPHAGYPFGAPARFAYVDRDRVLHVVEATSAEKGPFRKLASGKLDGPLTITLLDGDEAFLEVRLDDWADHASLEPSPTAGWGVPQNAIEFSLLSADRKSPATLYISLASTSIGRGWNSVGHSAGTYRNRMTVTLPSTSTGTRPATQSAAR